LSYYKTQIQYNIDNSNYHILQVKMIEKNLTKLNTDNSYDFSASDRDATLDILYMN